MLVRDVHEVPLFECVIEREPASKANSRRLVRFHGISRLIKSSKALSFAQFVKATVSPASPLLTGDLAIFIKIYYATRRPDLDESLILDVLQGVAYENDRQIKEKHIVWGLDKNNPRAIIKIYPLQACDPAGHKGRRKRD